jgi:hypothetical protein
MNLICYVLLYLLNKPYHFIVRRSFTTNFSVTIYSKKKVGPDARDISVNIPVTLKQQAIHHKYSNSRT